MEMRELHSEVARLQALGLAFSDVKAEIGRVVAAQKACREALAAAKGAGASSGSGSGSSNTGGGAAAAHGQERWVQRPGGLWLRLPAAQAEDVLRAESQQLGSRLEGLFARQQAVLAQLEKEGLGPEHFKPAA